MRLEDVYDADLEQELLARLLDPRYARMLVAVHELVASAFPELADFRLDDEATRMILEEAANRVVLIDAATRDAIREQLQVGQSRGYSSFQVAHGVPEEDFGGLDELFTTTWAGRAETVSRTELAQAQNVSSLNRYQATGMVKYVQIVENENTDGPCAERNGRIVPIAEQPGLLHPNCLPGDQVVWAAEVTGASAREFEGELVTLRTAADDLLACTPNHPILTPRGWVAAHRLTEGQYVLRCPIAQRKAVVHALDDDDVPARIEEVARALAVQVGRPALAVPGAAPQFHGDGRAEGDVHLIRANGLDQRGLRRRVGLEEPLAHLTVEGADAEPPLLSRLRTSDLALERVVAAASGSEGGFCDGAPVSGRPGAHAKAHSLARRARQAGLPDPVGRRAEVHAEALADRRAGHPVVHVEPTQDIRRRAPALGHGVPRAGQPAVQRGRPYAQLAGDRFEPADLEITPVVLVKVGQQHFTGHVYNLETRQGWYVAQGIVTHNCRMGLIPLVEGP